MSGAAGDPLAAFVAQALERPVHPGIDALAQRLAGRPGIAAILFYGNMLRDPSAGGLADLYVLTDHDRAWSGTGAAALGNWLLPPNVYHLRAQGAAPPVIHAKAGISGVSARDPRLRGDDARETDAPRGSVGAKVAVMRMAAFRHRMRRESWDTTLWARFAQPATLVWAREDAAREAVAEAIATGWRTAAWWADRLSDGSDRWAGLFAQTYRAELRPEGAGRSGSITAAVPELYAEIDRLVPPETPLAEEREAARRAWRRRRRVGHGLNAARLVKAAMTFRGGAAYALAKIDRHAGPEALRPWERRFPWLAAPVVLLRLLRRGGLR